MMHRYARTATWALAVGGMASCRAPTQVTVDLVGEIPYREGMKVTVQLAKAGEAEGAPVRVTAEGPWTYGGSVGTVVLGPNDDTTPTDVRVVLALDRDPTTCTTSDAKGCVVYRRRVSFVPGESSEVRAVLRASCLGIFCDAGTSCRADKSCGPLASDEPGPPPASTEIEGNDAYARALLKDRPRHYYRFDEAQGATVAKDEMGRANGTYDGAVKLGVTGALDASRATGAYFDGRGAKVSVPALEDVPGALSLEAWVRSDSPEGDSPTVAERLDRGKEGTLFGYRLSVPPTFEAKLELFRGAEKIVAPAPRLRNFGAGYTHIAAVAHAGKVRIYVNGKAANETPYRDEPPPPVVSPFIVGSGSAGHFRGAIDELAVYDYPLSAEAIAKHILASGTKLTP
jgi:hypothetical protein